MTIDFTTPIELTPVVKNYGWGKCGSESLVAKLSREEFKQDTPYAELWLGAHPSGSATCNLWGEKLTLYDLISQYPEKILGDSAYQRFGARLPFLFKVLSVAHPLSIQLHPNMAAAARLNQNAPTHYPDPFHKPELALALERCEFLWGFRTQQQVAAFLRNVPELSMILNIKESDIDHINISDLYRRLFHSSPSIIESASLALFRRLESLDTLSNEEKWVLKLSEIYPKGDIGIFSLFFLNLLELKPGDAIFTPPGVVHAYLSGQLAECMAASDNVVRAGLTSKFCDVETLLELADYSATMPNIFPASALADKILTPEFQIKEITGNTKITLLKRDSVQILFSASAEGEIKTADKSARVFPGTSLLFPANTPEFQVIISSGTAFHIIIP